MSNRLVFSTCTFAERQKLRRNGITLIELLVVVTLIVMVSAMATANFRGPLKRAQFQQAVAQAKQADLVIRRQCLETNRTHLYKIDCFNNQLSSKNHKSNSFLFFFQPAHSVDIAKQAAVGGKLNDQLLNVTFDSQGASKTYAICIRMGSIQRWLVFLGRSGQCIELETDDEVRQIFEIATSIGINTR